MNTRDLSIVLIIILGLLILLPALAMSLVGGWAMMGPGMLGGRGMMGYGAGVGALGLLILVTSTVLIVFLLTRGQPDADPKDTLKRRLAKGEISQEQFEELRQAPQ